MKLSLILLLLISLYGVSFGQTPPSENLLLHLPFDNNLDDISGHNNVAVKYGTTFVEDRKGNPNSAIYFDGIDDYIDILNNAVLNFGLSDFTISFWLKYPSQVGGHSPPTPTRKFDYATIFIKAANPDYPYEGITFFVDWHNEGDIHFRTSYIHGLNLKTDLNKETWNFYLLKRRGEELSVYVDGTMVGKTYHPIDNTTNEAGIRLGANHVDVLSQNFEGVMDDLKIYDKAIEDSEITFKEVQLNGTDFLCTGDTVELTATEGFDSYLWSTNETTRNIQATTGGNYWVKATTGSLNSIDSLLLKEMECDLLPDNLTLCNVNTYTTDVPAGYQHYLWSTGESSKDIVIDREGWYIIMAIYNNHVIKDSVYVQNELCFDGIIPNVITPGGDDDVNETFQIPQSLIGAELIIYNRWGRRIFYSSSYQNNWNAEGNESGVYFYYLNLKEFDFSYKGWINVMK